MLEKEASRNLDRLEIGALDASEIGEALGVISRGMRDNPIHVAAFGEVPERRRQGLRRFFGAVLAVMGLREHMLVARGEGGRIVGVMGMMPPGDCLPGSAQQLRMLPTLLRNGPRAAGRTVSWLRVWEKRDPEERHWHFGPLAVDAHLQGMGIGSKLLHVFCARMDAVGEDATWRPTRRSTSTSTSGSASRSSPKGRFWASPTTLCFGERGGDKADEYRRDLQKDAKPQDD